MTKRSFALFAVAAIGPAVWARGDARTFSFESNAARLPVLLERLGSVSGATLVASAGLAREVVAVRFHNVTLAEAKARLAAALGANWIDEQGTFRLIANEQAQQADWRAETKVLAEGFAASIKRMAKETLEVDALGAEEARKMAQEARQMFSGGPGGRGGGPGGMMARFSAMAGRSPGGRAIARLLQTMNPADLAAIQPGSRVVFANPSNRSQMGLPASAWRAVETFLQEQKVFNETMRQAQGDEAPLPFMGVMSDVPGRAAKAYLIINRPPIGETLTIQFIVANQEGQTMGFGFGSLTAEPAPVPAEEATATEEQPIAVSNFGKTLANLLGDTAAGAPGAISVTAVAPGGRGGGRAVNEFTMAEGAFALMNAARPKLAPDLLAFVLNPERNEPLATAPGDLYLGLAKARNRNLVAVLPDRLFIPANRRAAAGPIRPSDVTRLSRSDWRMDVREDADWIIARPMDPVGTRADRVDRAALGVMLRVLDERGELRLDDLAAYARTMPVVGSLNGLDMTYLRVVDPPTATREIGRMFSGGRDMLRLYATFSAAQKQSLASGRPLAIGALTPDQRAIVGHMVFNSFDGPRVQSANRGGRGGPGGMGGPRGMMMGFLDPATERTEVLSGGVPMQAEIRMEVSEEVSILASNAATKASQVFSPESLGRMLARNERPEFAAIAANVVFDEFRIGREIEHEFTFVLGTNVTMRRELSDTTFDRSRRGVALASLPDSVRQQIERSKQEASTMMNRGEARIRTMPGGQREP